MVVMDIGREDLNAITSGRVIAGSNPNVAAGWTPLAGNALLDRLRVTGRPRPLADPERVARLRDNIERGLDQGTAAKAEGGRGRLAVPCSPKPVAPQTTLPKPVVITKDRLTRALDTEPHLGANACGVQA